MKPRNAAPINLDKCHRPFCKLFDTTGPGHGSNTNAMNARRSTSGVGTRILKSD
jgi:hypothetical protein